METQSNSPIESKGNPKVKKTNNLLSRLREEGDKNAQMITGTKNNTISSSDEKKSEVALAPDKIITNQENENLSEKIETNSLEQKTEIVEEIKQSLTQKSTLNGIAVFTKDRKVEKEVVSACISRSQRDELKLVGTALGINMQDLIANIFDNFFEENQVEIKKAKKKLLG